MAEAENEKIWGSNMMILILGGSGCGKSAYAEKRIMKLAADTETVYYLATMQVYGEEGRKKVARHIELRKDKGMLTIEQTRDVKDAIPQMEPGPRAVLLEDLGNLVANEMFTETESFDADFVTTKVCEHIGLLNESVEHLVIVSNNVFEDGITYEEGTQRYITALGRIHTELARLSDEVVEVVVGIPCHVKGGEL